MTDEQKILNSFRAMDADTQQEMVIMLQNIAREFPRPPKLRLVHSANIDIIALHSGGGNS